MNYALKVSVGFGMASIHQKILTFFSFSGSLVKENNGTVEELQI